VDGTFSIDGYIDLRRHGDDEVADLIQQRLTKTTGPHADRPRSPRPVLSEQLDIEPGTHLVIDVKLVRNEYVQIDVMASAVLDIAVFSPIGLRSWRSTGSLKASLHHFKQVRSLNTPFTASRKSTYHLLLINYGRHPSRASLRITEATPEHDQHE
jgi:hypothetical protein